MIRTITVFILCLAGFAGGLRAECNIDPDKLGAHYGVTIGEAHNAPKLSEPFTLWRNGLQVAYEYPEPGITDLWERTANGRLRLVRHFDKHERGIEYQPGEIRLSVKTDAWILKRQLISNELIESMELEKAWGEDCDRVEVYTRDHGEKRLVLEWLPVLELAKKFTMESPEGQRLWSLEKIVTDGGRVAREFAEREGYRMTDYADIGDHESDPFFLRMMNLGYIGHGSSGFYDAQGNAVEGNAGHRH